MDDRLNEIIPQMIDLSSNKVCMIGIYGLGGIGKTTIAKVVYNRIAPLFIITSFISNVREDSKSRGLLHLQKQLLHEILPSRKNFISNVDEGIHMIQDRLCFKSVLLILDDVNTLDQLEALAGDRNWFSLGSRIIVTTRDRHLLDVHKMDAFYEVKKVDHMKAIELFSQHAFEQKHPKEDYETLSNSMACCVDGLPLGLKSLGRFLFGKTILEWERTEAIEGILFDLSIPKRKRMDITTKSFEMMTRLSFYAKDLVELDMCYNSLKQLWESDEPLEKLNTISVSFSQHLMEIPDFSIRAPNLEKLILDGCSSFLEVHPSIGRLKKIIVLNIKNCKKLGSFPSIIDMEALKILNFAGCSELKKFPDIQCNMEHLLELYLSSTTIEELSSSIGWHITGLVLLDLNRPIAEECWEPVEGTPFSFQIQDKNLMFQSYQEIMSNVLENANKPESIMGVEEVWCL
ncbi:TMV resistance protein N [Vitis vinifera]|uniref:TMV resistance protein N n=1 Tax=Vitis vinifera TaxID=29760 RepID=A0A438IWW3_VITVI|nr:TMV resistance protein N [Vitis vinifera]